MAQGDKRSFVAVDRFGEVYSIPRTLGIKTSEVRKRLGDLEGYPSVEQAIRAAKLLDVIQEHVQAKEPSNDCAVTSRIKRDPEHVLDFLSEKESVFTRQQIAKTLNTYLKDPLDYQAAYAQVMASDKLVELPTVNTQGNQQPRYSTCEMIDCESSLMRDANQMANTRMNAPPVRSTEIAICNVANNLRETYGVELNAE